MRWLGPLVPCLVAIGLSLACGASPEAEDAERYVAAMQAPLGDNAVLAQRFLTDASKVKKATTDGGKLAEELSRDLAPQADALARTVAGIEPTEPKLRDTHAVIVKAWRDRADAYGAMRDAWSAGDLAAWDVATKKNTQSKLDEEEYFLQVNAYLSPYGFLLEQYPE